MQFLLNKTFTLKLSIITCTYNSGKYLQNTIDSVTSQNDGLDYEHIFIDGISNDTTCDIIKKYAANNPSVSVTLEPRNPKGIYNAMNEWIKLASWDFILFLNSDDFLSNNILSRYISFVKENPGGDVYHAKFQQVYQDIVVDTFPKNSFFSKILFHIGFNTFVFHPTCLIKRSLFAELGLYDESKKIASDFWFWLACLTMHKKFIFFPEIVTNFRIHGDSMTSNPANKESEITEVSFFRKKYFWCLGLIVDQVSLFYRKFIFPLLWK